MVTTDDDFLPDEYVLDDVPDDGPGPAVIFAGPSDAPPVLPPAPAPPAPRASPSRGHYKLVAAACLSVAVVVGAILGVRRPTPARDAVSVVGASPASDPAPESSAATAISPKSTSSAVTAPQGSASSDPVPALSAASSPSASAQPDAENPTLTAAKQAKQEAEHALEKGRTTIAIEAGARAVALDPTDAEAWLILGAGYDQRRSYDEARKCFATCARVATHGPRRECAALLR
jgi:Flp pilus assembly protein TadD